MSEEADQQQTHHQALLFETAQNLAHAIAEAEKLGGAKFKEGIAAELVPQCKAGLKVFGIKDQIETELIDVLKKVSETKIRSSASNDGGSLNNENNPTAVPFSNNSSSSATTIESKNNAPSSSAETKKSNNNLRWTMMFQELRSLKRKFPQQNKSIPAVLQEKFAQQQSNNANSYSNNLDVANSTRTIENLVNSNKYVLPSVDTELGDLFRNSFAVIHIMVDCCSLVKEFGPGAVSQLLVNNDTNLRNEAIEWLRHNNKANNFGDEQNEQTNSNNEGILTNENGKRHLIEESKIEETLNAIFHSHLQKKDLLSEKEKQAANDEKNQNKKNVVDENTTKTLLLSTEWLKVDSVLLVKNGSFFRHPFVSDFFQSPPSLLTLMRKAETSSALSTVVEDFRNIRERKMMSSNNRGQQVVSSSNSTVDAQQEGEDGEVMEKKPQDTARTKVHPTAVGQDSADHAGKEKKTAADDNLPTEIVPIKFVGSECVSSVLGLIAKVC